MVLLKSESRKTKKGFWISEDLDEKVDIYLRLDNCASRSEFMENALRFYIGYLNTKNAGGFLPEALSAMLTGTLDNFAGRMGSLLFKQGVDLNVLGPVSYTHLFGYDRPLCGQLHAGSFHLRQHLPLRLGTPRIPDQHG